MMQSAPRLLDHLDPADAEHFADVRNLLDVAQIPYEIDSTLVRGLDYYTRTLFEFTSDALGAQSGVGGGGRYDGLIEQLGGGHTPGMGWAAGVERMLLAGDPQPAPAHELGLFLASMRAPHPGGASLPGRAGADRRSARGAPRLRSSCRRARQG